MTSRKKVVGDSSGNWIDQKRRHGRAPSIAAASTSDFGMLARPARKNKKLYEICFQTAAITIRIIACLPFSRLSHLMPSACSQYDAMPMLGENMNNHSTP